MRAVGGSSLFPRQCRGGERGTRIEWERVKFLSLVPKISNILLCFENWGVSELLVWGV